LFIVVLVRACSDEKLRTPDRAQLIDLECQRVWRVEEQIAAFCPRSVLRLGKTQADSCFPDEETGAGKQPGPESLA